MIDRNHIERILRLNGLNPTAPDEEIRSVLISAKWHKDDVETALTVLRENMNTHKSHVETLHNVFLTDKRLSPEAIQSLLGINVEMNSAQLESMRESRRHMSLWQAFSIMFYATILALTFILVIMYVQHFGVFHPGV